MIKEARYSLFKCMNFQICFIYAPSYLSIYLLILSINHSFEGSRHRQLADNALILTETETNVHRRPPLMRYKLEINRYKFLINCFITGNYTRSTIYKAVYSSITKFQFNRNFNFNDLIIGMCLEIRMCERYVLEI